MATASVLYFHGDTELTGVWPEQDKNIVARFPEWSRKQGVVSDSFSCMVGHLPGSKSNEWVPATRRIEFKKFASLHKCDARCTHAKGNKCECSCGGRFHGINR